MNAAFFYFAAAPTTGARIFTGGNPICTRHTTDRQEAIRFQRMVRQFEFFKVVIDHGLRPTGQNVDFDASVRGFKLGKCGTCVVLIGAAPGEPGVKFAECPVKRRDLADETAFIRAL